jgi:hypothetical protein
MPRPPQRILAGPLTLLAIAVVAGATACGGEGATSAVPADQAAESVVATYDLGPEDQACLEGGFADDAEARSALDPAGAPSADQLDRLAAVVLACVGTDRLGASIATSMAVGIGTLDEDQERCVAAAVVALPEADLRVLVSGLSSPAVIGGVSERAVRLGEVTNGLFAACSVSVVDEPGPPTSGEGDLGAVPDEDTPSG